MSIMIYLGKHCSLDKQLHYFNMIQLLLNVSHSPVNRDTFTTNSICTMCVSNRLSIILRNNLDCFSPEYYHLECVHVDRNVTYLMMREWIQQSLLVGLSFSITMNF